MRTYIKRYMGKEEKVFSRKTKQNKTEKTWLNKRNTFSRCTLSFRAFLFFNYSASGVV